MSDFSPDELRVLGFIAGSSSFVMDRHVIGRAGGKEEAKKMMRKFEGKGLIERTGVGNRFRVTDQGEKFKFEVLACEDCGNEYYSRHHANSGGNGSFCECSNLSVSMKSFGGDKNEGSGI